MKNAVSSMSSTRASASLRFMAFVIVLVVAGAGYWYYSARQRLVCGPAAGASWRLTWADGNGVAKFMWAIEPADQQSFLQCLGNIGFDIATDKSTGLITADSAQGVTYSNSVGDGFVQAGTFYAW